MVYADRAEVRKLSGGFSVTNVPDAHIDEIIVFSDRLVDTLTNRDVITPWATNDDFFPLVKEASNYFASSRLREEYADKDGVSNDHRTIGENLCAQIVANAPSPLPNPSVVTLTKAYQTFPLNPQGKIHRSVFGGSDVGFTPNQDQFQGA